MNIDKPVIPIVFSSSNEFIPYLYVCLLSLLEHINNEYEYDICIFENDLTEYSKNELYSLLCNGNTNINLNFINLNDLTKTRHFFSHDHVPMQTFFKLYIPIMLKKYDKVLFFDSDIIFLDNPAELYKTNLQDKKIGASLCNFWNGIINHTESAYKYTVNDLKIKNVNQYFQGGVLLFNNKLITEEDVNNLLTLACKRSYICLDQDILNLYFQDDVLIFDSKWNYENSQKGFRQISIPYMDEIHKTVWEKAAQSPLIIHYSGKEKPWLYPEEDNANIWWNYARKTPFYEEIIARLVKFHSPESQSLMKEIENFRSEFAEIHFPNINNYFSKNEYQKKLLYAIEHLGYFRMQKFILFIKKNFSFGEKRKNTEERYQKLDKLLKDASDYKNSLRKV